MKRALDSMYYFVASSREKIENEIDEAESIKVKEESQRGKYDEIMNHRLIGRNVVVGRD